VSRTSASASFTGIRPYTVMNRLRGDGSTVGTLMGIDHLAC
jgi:hypothetical protein